MRAVLALLCFASACMISAQTIPNLNLKPALGALRERGLLPDPRPAERTALDPKPTLGESPQSGALPAPMPTDPQSPEIRLIKGNVSRSGDTLRVTGGAQIQSRGYDMEGQEIVGDLVSRVFQVRGGAQVTGANGVIRGETITVDMRNRTFFATQHRGTLSPSFLSNRVLSDVYVDGDEASGSEREIFLRDCNITTCDLEKPHFHLNAEYATIRPEKRMILRNTRLRVLGKTVLKIPFLSIPLDTRRERYTPEVGRSPDQGYYIKTVWGVPVSGNRTLDTYVDYFEKLGVGLGGRLRFAGEKYTGFLRSYGLFGSTDTLELGTGLRQQFGSSLFAIEGNFQQRNYINAPQNTSLNLRSSLTIPQGPNTTRFSHTLYSNEGLTFDSLNQTFGFNDQRSWGNRLKTDLDLTYSAQETNFATSNVTRKQIDVRFKGAQDFRTLIAELIYNRAIPVGDTTNFFSATDRTPVFAVRTDSSRVLSTRVARQWPVQTEFSIGEFANRSRSERITRTFFDVQLNKPAIVSGRNTFTFNGRFRQGVYSDGTAQFATQLNTSYAYRFTPQSSFNLRYSLLRPRGFSPLSIDRFGSTNFASADLSVQPIRSLVLGVQSGYDFRANESGHESPWQQVAVRAEYKPFEELQSRALSIYDPVSRKWSNTRIDVTFNKGDLYAGLGARYDGIRNRWANVNVYVDGLKLGKCTASALFAYNGYTSKFDSWQFQLVYDLHCTEAVLQVIDNNVGFRSGREIYFYLRIKALPYQSPFGVGRFGQPIGTATGFGF